MDVLTQVKLIDSVFDVLQDFRLFGKLLGPTGIEIETERIQMRVDITATANFTADQ